MATYLSRPQPYRDPLPTFNFELLSRGLQYKQTQVDQNAAIIQSEIDKYSSIDLYRDIDKNYFANKLNAAVSQINSMQGADWSSASTATMFRSQLRDVVDDKVINAAMSTKAIRATQSAVEAAKKDGTYAVDNEFAAFYGMDDYLANQEVGAKFTPAGYTPYHDVDAEMRPYLENLQKYVPSIKKQYSNGEGYFVDEFNQVLSYDKVRSVAASLLSPKAKTQLQITGMYNYMRKGTEGVRAAEWQNLKDTELSYQDSVIKSNQARIDAPNTPKEEKDRLIKQNNELQARKDEITTLYSQLEKDPRQVSYLIQQNKFLDKMGNQYQFSKYEQGLSNDTSYWARKNFELEVEKFEYQKVKDGRNSDGTLLPIPEVMEDVPDRDVIEETYSTIEKTNQSISAFVQKKAENPETAKAIATYDEQYESLSPDQKKGLTRDMYVIDKLNRDGHLSIAEREEVDGYVTESINMTTAYTNAAAAVEKELEDEKLPTTIKDLVDSDRTMVVNGQTIAIGDYIRQNGITPENINTAGKSTQKKEILKALHADSVIQEESFLSKVWEGAKEFISNIPRGFSPTGAGMAINNVVKAYRDEEQRQTVKNKRRLARINGEDPLTGKTPKTDAYLEQVRKAGAYKTTVPRAVAFTGAGAVYFADRIFTDNQAKTFISQDEYQKRLADRLPKQNLPGMNSFAIPPDTNEFNQLITAFNANPSIVGKIDKGTALNVRPNKADPSQITVFQKQDKGEIVLGSVDLRSVPAVNASINFNNARPRYTPETFRGVNEPVKILTSADFNIIEDMAENVYVAQGYDINRAVVAAKTFNTKSGILSTLSSGAYGSLMVNPDGTPTKYAQLVEKVLNDTNLSVDLKPGKTGVAITIQKAKEDLYSFDYIIPYGQLEPAIKKAKYTPAENVYVMLEQMLKEKAERKTESIFNQISSKYQQ